MLKFLNTDEVISCILSFFCVIYIVLGFCYRFIKPANTSMLGPYLEKPGASRELFKFCDSYQTSNLVVHLWIILPQRHPLFGKANYWPRIRLQKDTYLIQRWWCCHCCWTKNKLGKWHLWWKTWRKKLCQIQDCCINWKLL